MFRTTCFLYMSLMCYMLIQVIGKDQLRSLDCYDCYSTFNNQSMNYRVKECEQNPPPKSYLKKGEAENKSKVCSVFVQVANKDWQGIGYTIHRRLQNPDNTFNDYRHRFPKHADEGNFCYQWGSLNISQPGLAYAKTCICIRDGCNGPYSMDQMLHMKMPIINEMKT